MGAVPDRPSRTEVGTWHPVLGTVLELQTTAPDLATVERAEAEVLATIDALEDVFSIYRDTSELSRWRRGDELVPGPELRAVLALTATWFARGQGAFNPAVGRILARWRRAEAEGVLPADHELDAAAAAVAALPYAVEGDRIVRTGDCSGIELHAIAKGWIVDRACEVALAVPGVERVVVNLGGDLRHAGAGALRVAIEDPAQPYDNAPPLTVIEVRERAVATSGSARRGVRVGGQWYGHVIDPRTARPVAHVASVSVIAADAAGADVVATVAGVLATDEALAFVDALDDAVGVLVVGADGSRRANETWRSHERAADGA